MLRTLPQWAVWLTLVAVVRSLPQSNYNLQNLDVEFENISFTKEQSLEGLPEFGTLDGIVTELGKIILFVELQTKCKYALSYTTTTTISLCLKSLFYCLNCIELHIVLWTQHHNTLRWFCFEIKKLDSSLLKSFFPRHHFLQHQAQQDQRHSQLRLWLHAHRPQVPARILRDCLRSERQKLRLQNCRERREDRQDRYSSEGLRYCSGSFHDIRLALLLLIKTSAG